MTSGRASAHQDLPRLGKYQLIRKIAAGGMAEVFLARSEGPAGFSKLAVVKRILPHLIENEEFVQMFLNEARLAAQLNHPNVIQIFELGQQDDIYFLAMEVVDGPNLRKLTKATIKAGEKLPVPAALRMISLACEGLAYAHEFRDERGRALELVHRDISPDNLLLSRQGSVKVADFGIAKASTLPSLTKSGTIKGKVSYMAPEQIRGMPLDKRSDLFSLGVVLHEVLSGTKPFDSESEVSAMRSILQDDPRRICELRSDVPPAIQPILDRALAKDRDARYPDCRAFQADLERLLMTFPEPVRPMDLAALVERYFPREPVAETAPGQDAELASVESSLLRTARSGALDGLATNIKPRSPPRTAPGLQPTREAPRPSGRAVPLAIGVGAVVLLGVGGFVLTHHPDAPRIERITVPLRPASPARTAVASPAPDPGDLPAPAPKAPPAPAPAPKAPPAPAPAPVAVAAPAPAPAPRREAPHAHRRPARPGSVAVYVQPWAAVSVDGKPYGITPIKPIALPAGRHQVELSNTDLHVKRTKAISVRSGQETVLKVNLAE